MIGALIGKQEGRNIEVMNSFELLHQLVDDRAHIDKEYYYTKEEQCESHHTYTVCVHFTNLPYKEKVRWHLLPLITDGDESAI